MVSKLYHAALRLAHQNHTITYQLQRWQRAEPLVFILAAAAAGIYFGRIWSFPNVLLFSAGLVLGALLGHLFWGGQAKR